MATHKHVLIVHPKFGEVLNETFMDEVQFKIFLNMVHSSIESEVVMAKSKLEG